MPASEQNPQKVEYPRTRTSAITNKRDLHFFLVHDWLCWRRHGEVACLLTLCRRCLLLWWHLATSDHRRAIIIAAIADFAHIIACPSSVVVPPSKKFGSSQFARCLPRCLVIDKIVADYYVDASFFCTQMVPRNCWGRKRIQGKSVCVSGTANFTPAALLYKNIAASSISRCRACFLAQPRSNSLISAGQSG